MTNDKMQWGGTIDSEEKMVGFLSDGRTVIVDAVVTYERAPEDQRDDPEYWRQCIERGDFDDPENYPTTYITKK